MLMPHADPAPADPIAVTAFLWDVQMVTDQHGRFLIGEVYADDKKRWLDGSRIFTDHVADEVEPDTFRTQSGSVFQVCSWAPAITAF
jgi:hypothetical protein